MASVNKVILIGNLGRVARNSLDGAGQEAFDRYVDALRGYGAAIGTLAAGFAESARKLAEASRQLHERAMQLVLAKKVSACSMPIFNRTAAFFHAAKVDGRNLP